MKKQLTTKRVTKFLKKDKKNSSIVIGAPHHAPGGVEELPCPDHKVSDENTGFIAWEISKSLKTHAAIACYAKIDPNKKLDTSYSKQIIKWSPKYLIEIHGHGGVNVDEKVIEISSGNAKRNRYSEKFASVLQKKFSAIDSLKNYTVNGNYNDIYFKAKGTATIIDNRWIPFHIELPPSLRINEKKGLPEISKFVIESIIETIKEVCI